MRAFRDSLSVTAAVAVSTALLLVTSSAYAKPDFERGDAPHAGNVGMDSSMVATSHSDAGIERHDGFYLRISSSFGPLATYSSVEAGSVRDVELRAIVWDVMTGGTPVPGFTVGGAFRLEYAYEADAARRGDGTTMGSIGPFVDVFPNPRGGFHFGGMVGAAGLTYGVADSEAATYGGVGAGVWLGYDLWIAQQWSVGAMLTGSVARLERTDGGAADLAQVDSASLLIGWLYH